MSKLRFTVLSASLLATFLFTVTPGQAASCSRALRFAESTPCVQERLAPYREAQIFKELQSTTDNGDNTATVVYTFVPTCLDDPIPCRIATQTLTFAVSCTEQQAICQ